VVWGTNSCRGIHNKKIGIVAVSLYSDATNSGKNVFHPIHLELGNSNLEFRESSFGKLLIGFIPNLALPSGHDKTPEDWTLYKVRIFHKCL